MREMTPLERGRVYHIYNRGTNGVNVFIETKNYSYFLKKWEKFVEPIAETYAYCLLRNHFHFLLRVRAEEVVATDPDTGIIKVLDPCQSLSNFFNSYAQSINKMYARTGSLFEHPYKRILVDNPIYFKRLITYIHFNPQGHGFTNDFRDYPWSSYTAHLTDKPTRLKREEVMTWFESREQYSVFHQSYRKFGDLKDLIEEAE